MTTKEKLIYAIGTEIDQYINIVQENVIDEPEVREFIIKYVVPRFNKLRDIVNAYDEDT